MNDNKQAMRERRLKVWADLTFLEKMAERSRRILGTVPAHWEQARKLLWRDLLALLGGKQNDNG